MASARELESKLKAKPDSFVLKPNSSGKADIWKQFFVLYKKQDAAADHDPSDDTSLLIEQKYFCACVKCLKVYAYKAPDGSSFGTKNLIDHVKSCSGTKQQGQMSIQQCLTKKPSFTMSDLAQVKRREVEYCVEGYHAFRSVEHTGFINILQTFTNMGAKYGKFNVADMLVKRKAVTLETTALASAVKTKLTEKLKEPIEDETVSLCLDLYTDDYRKKAYLDVHSCWIDRDFTLHHAVLAVRHFGVGAHTGDNILSAVKSITDEYGLSADNTPVTTDHGSNVVAALRNGVRLDCVCHRLHTVLETAWRDTKASDSDAQAYEVAISELCRYVKQATGIQEQLPKSLKHGGDTRPWVSMFRRADAVECSYEKLVSILTSRDKLDLVANVNRALNKELLSITKAVKDVFESLEKVNEPTLHLVAPSYYLLITKLQTAAPRECASIALFRANLKKYMDQKFWTSIKALHWMASFLDPTFKGLHFLPNKTRDDTKFKQDLSRDLDVWLTTEMITVTEKKAEQTAIATDRSAETLPVMLTIIESEPEPKRSRFDPFADLRDSTCTSSSSSSAASTSQQACAEELAKYKALRVSPAVASNSNPLLFWKLHYDEFPILAATARRVLCISASSAQSERDFSSVGHTVTDVRSRLSPEKVEAIELVRSGIRARILDM